MRVMIVDDSEVMRRIEKNVLSKHGVETIVEAKDGMEALEKLREGIPDLILLDWNMPGMDGMELAKKLRAHETLKKTPIVMVTSEAERRKVMEALKAGVTNYVVKPFTEEILWEKIEKVVNKARESN